MKSLETVAALFDSSSPLAPLYNLSFEPGQEQRRLIAATLRNIADGVELSLFPGAAGTGKTTTLKLLLAVLAQCGVSYSVAAPTWKAANRAKECLDGVAVGTIHGIIYAGAEEVRDEVQAKDKEGNLMWNEDGSPLMIPAEFGDELLFNRRDSGTAKVGQVLIIDEASMVGKDLANDMWEALPPGTQVVAVGDPHQLPPVDQEPGFALDTAPIELKTVYRQAEGSAVLQAATAIRQEKVPFTYSKIALWQRGDAILKESGVKTKWMDVNEAGAALVAMMQRNDGDAVAIVGTHQSRVMLNDATRKHLGFASRSNGPQKGERVVCRATGAGLQNSDMAIVTEVEDADFGPDFGDGWIFRVKLVGSTYEREVAVLRRTWNGDCQPKFRGLVPFSVRQNMDRYIEEDMEVFGKQIAKVVEAKQLSWEEKKGEEAPEWLVSIWSAQEARRVGANALYLKKYLASLDSGYAITCHQAQGSQYGEIMVVADMVDFIADEEKKDVYRWSYTALTRAVTNALVVKKSKGGWER